MGEFVLFGLTISVFWMALSVLFIISLVSEANENGFWAGFGFILFGIAVYYWDATNFQWLLGNLLYYGPIYLGIGIVFALIKFYFWGRSNGKKYLELKSRWMTKNKFTAMDNEAINNFHKDNYEARDLIDPSKFKNHAFRWWLNWPGSMLWWVLSDMLRNLWDLVWSKVKIMFKNIFESGFNSTAKQQ